VYIVYGAVLTYTHFPVRAKWYAYTRYDIERVKNNISLTNCYRSNVRRFHYNRTYIYIYVSDKILPVNNNNNKTAAAGRVGGYSIKEYRYITVLSTAGKRVKWWWVSRGYNAVIRGCNKDFYFFFKDSAPTPWTSPEVLFNVSSAHTVHVRVLTHVCTYTITFETWRGVADAIILNVLCSVWTSTTTICAPISTYTQNTLKRARARAHRFECQVSLPTYIVRAFHRVPHTESVYLQRRCGRPTVIV